MKIAVASSDGVSISRHFGRSGCFLVFEVQDGVIRGKEVRDNTYTAHAQGECQENESHEHDHSHADVLSALHDCEAVLCLGMGWRAAQDLEANGIRPYLLPNDCTPEAAVLLMITGKLQSGGGFCRCHG